MYSGWNNIGFQNGLLVHDYTSTGLTMPNNPNPNMGPGGDLGQGKLRPNHAEIWVSGNAIRWRADGKEPTSDSGMFVPANSYLNFTDADFQYAGFLANLKMISMGPGDAILEIAYFD